MDTCPAVWSFRIEVVGLRSRLTFADISVPEAVISLRLHDGTDAWLPLPRPILDLMAGIPLVYAGERAVVCHAGCITPAVRNLLTGAGHSHHIS
jgi:hypothetical protein